MYTRWRRWGFGCFQGERGERLVMDVSHSTAAFVYRFSPPGKTVKVDSATGPCAEGRNVATKATWWTPAQPMSANGLLQDEQHEPRAIILRSARILD
jgi:hypothetical protein